MALQKHLHHLTQTLFACLMDLNERSTAARKTLKIPSACPQSPIFAIQAQRPKQLASLLQSRGMMVRAVVPPTVPAGTERVRVCLHAGNTVVEVTKLVRVLEEWCNGTSHHTVGSSVEQVALQPKL
jgi:8-amino-7-oxononanoate synthase